MLGPRTGALQDREGGNAPPPSPSDVLLVPDASKTTGPRTYYCLSSRPRVRQGARNDPMISITLVLNRAPGPTDENVYPLIDRALLNLQLTLAVPDDLRAAMVPDSDHVYRPLFVRQGEMRLATDQGQVLLQGSLSTGESPEGSLSGTLDRGQALGLLVALEGATSGLRLAWEVGYRSVGPPRTVQMTGSWRDVYDFLAKQTDEDQTLALDVLRRAFAQMVSGENPVLSVWEIGAAENQPVLQVDSDELFDTFLPLASVVLRQIPAGAEEVRYALRDRPSERFRLDMTRTVRAAKLESVRNSCALEAVLGGRLAGLDRDLFISLVSPHPTNGGFDPVGTRILAGPDRSDRDKAGNDAPIELFSRRAGIHSVAAVLRPDTGARPAAALAATELATPVHASPSVHVWALQEVVLDIDRAQDLPEVTDPSRRVWRSRAGRGKYWYLPEFQVVRPAANTPPDASPFLFSFSRIGATSSGNPAIQGSIRLTLTKGKGASVLSELQALGSPPAGEIPLSGLCAALEIPFVNEADNVAMSHTLPARVEVAGDQATVTVDVLNDWLRLAYGALAVAGFQQQPAKVVLSYSYRAYLPKRNKFQLAYGIKQSLLPVIYTSTPTGGRDVAHFDATEGVYRYEAGEIRLRRETASVNPALMLAATARRGPATIAAASVAARPAISVAGTRPVVVPLGNLRPHPEVVHVVDKTEFVLGTLVREEKADVLYPCNELGQLYREEVQSGSVGIGCVQALELGKIALRFYEELAQLAHPLYRVYRSLAQPGRFLVVPTSYRIGRFAATDPERAFRPVIYLYSVLDPDNIGANRYVYRAALEPVLPPYVRKDLALGLTAFAAEPVIEYPHAASAEVEYAWTIPAGLAADLKAVRTPEGFQLALAGDLTATLLIRDILQSTGIQGTVSFKFADGFQVHSSLALDLREITGPWDSGPIEVTRSGDSVRLSNRITVPVVVSDLAVYESSGRQTVPVETSIPAGGSQTVQVPESATEICPVFSVSTSGTASLEEIRSFVEDVQLNVIFSVEVNYANHGLKRLDIAARVKGEESPRALTLTGDPPVGEFLITLPLTTFIDRCLIEFQVTKSFESGQVEVTPWRDWDLERDGVLISIVWPMIQ